MPQALLFSSYELKGVVMTCRAYAKMATPGPAGGYDYDFVEDTPKSLECPICFLILREPLLIDCCGHHICRSCVTRIQRDRKPCPLCQARNFSSMLNKGLQRTVNELKIRCPNRELGCDWVGELGQVGSHLNHPHVQGKGHGCQFEEVECAHSCGERLQRRFVTQHENVECPQRPFSCKYCKYKATYCKVVDVHWPVCECYPLPCPNECDIGSIPRNELEKHLNVDCPLQVVNCEFSYAGCDIVLQRKHMPAHLDASLQQHLSLLAVENQALRQEVDQLKQQQAKMATKSDVKMVPTLIQEIKHLKLKIKEIESKSKPARSSGATGVRRDVFTVLSQRRGASPWD